MKVIIAGSRNITNRALLDACMAAVQAEGLEITEIVSGGAPGVDLLGEAWARQHNIPIRRFPADWTRYGRAAGPKRNAEMARYADHAVLLWDGKSAGTANMRAQMTDWHHPRRCISLYIWRGRTWKPGYAPTT